MVKPVHSFKNIIVKLIIYNGGLIHATLNLTGIHVQVICASKSERMYDKTIQ